MVTQQRKRPWQAGAYCRRANTGKPAGTRVVALYRRATNAIKSKASPGTHHIVAVLIEDVFIEVTVECQRRPRMVGLHCKVNSEQKVKHEGISSQHGTPPHKGRARECRNG